MKLIINLEQLKIGDRVFGMAFEANGNPFYMATVLELRHLEVRVKRDDGKLGSADNGLWVCEFSNFPIPHIGSDITNGFLFKVDNETFFDCEDAYRKFEKQLEIEKQL